MLIFELNAIPTEILQSRVVIEKARKSNTVKKRSQETKNLLSKTRQANVEKANQTVRSKKGRASSGYKGVYSKRNRWEAKIKIDGKDVCLGVFDSKEQAAHEYDFIALKYYEKSYLNFPKFDYQNFKPTSSRSKVQKLDSKKAKQIRIDRKKGDSVKDISKRYGISVANTYRVIHGIYYQIKDFASVNVVYNPSSSSAGGK